MVIAIGARSAAIRPSHSTHADHQPRHAVAYGRFSLILAAVLFLAALKVVQTREY
jgi:hypothetical protein